MNQLFITYIRSFPYFGRVQYSAYVMLAEDIAKREAFSESPSFKHFKSFQAWEANPLNHQEIEAIKLANFDRMEELLAEYDIKWNNFRANARLKLPTVRSLTETVGMFPTVLSR